MRDTPRMRRLRSDQRALEELRRDSSIFSYDCWGTPPETYVLKFHGRGLWRAENSGRVTLRDQHEVRIHLGANYPRMMPELSWQSPIFHPNISASGIVCIGGYGTHWVPSLNLAELAEMLWDMLRYANFDVNSPYNREAAMWARSQGEFRLPVDPRSLRDKLAAGVPRVAAEPSAVSMHIARPAPPATTPGGDEVIFLGDVLEAEIVDNPDQDDILIIE